MAIPPEERKRLEDIGEAQVRLQFNTNAFGTSALQIYAGMWLAEFDEEARRRTEALQAKRTQLAENTLRVAWFAVYAALGAIVVGILAWIFPLH